MTTGDVLAVAPEGRGEEALSPEQRDVLTDFILTASKFESGFHDLLLLMKSPQDEQTLKEFSLFRRELETLKENFVFCGIVEISRFLNHLALACSEIQREVFSANGEIREALLQAFDHAIQYARALLKKAALRVEILPLDPLLRRLSCVTSQAQASEVARDIFCHVAESFDVAQSLSYRQAPMFFPPVNLADYLSDAECLMLVNLSSAQEKRNPYWKDRISSQLNLALAVNGVLDNPCDARQLIVGICFHDIGMMMLPDSILLKTSHLDPDETRQIQNHVADSCNCLGLSDQYLDAVLMISHHHERCDGSGYPGRLEGEAICIGGQIIGLADAYYSMTHQRPDRTFQRSVFRTLIEMNQAVGAQFSSGVMSAFNRVIRDELNSARMEDSALPSDSPLVIG